MRRLLHLLRGILHAAFWLASVFVLVCVLGGLRWARPGANATAADVLPFCISLLAALGLFTAFYVYDAFFGDRPERP